MTVQEEEEDTEHVSGGRAANPMTVHCTEILGMVCGGEPQPFH